MKKKKNSLNNLDRKILLLENNLKKLNKKRRTSKTVQESVSVSLDLAELKSQRNLIYNTNNYDIKNKTQRIGGNPYPKDVETCLNIISAPSYNSYGFPVLFLDYNYAFKKWSISFRNPVDFENPNTESKTAIEACHRMLDFMNKRSLALKKNK